MPRRAIFLLFIFFLEYEKWIKVVSEEDISINIALCFYTKSFCDIEKKIAENEMTKEK
jgi:hypothetical protein